MASDPVPPAQSPSTSKFLAYFAGVSSVVTLCLTVANAYWAQSISRLEADLKAREAGVKEKQVTIEEAKERLARYAFVQTSLTSALGQDPRQAAIALNLIRLALTEQEASQLFRGLSLSNDPPTQTLGQAGLRLESPDSIRRRLAESMISSNSALRDVLASYRSSVYAADWALVELKSSHDAEKTLVLLDHLSATRAEVWSRPSFTTAWAVVGRLLANPQRLPGTEQDKSAQVSRS